MLDEWTERKRDVNKSINEQTNEQTKYRHLVPKHIWPICSSPITFLAYNRKKIPPTYWHPQKITSTDFNALPTTSSFLECFLSSPCFLFGPLAASPRGICHFIPYFIPHRSSHLCSLAYIDVYVVRPNADTYDSQISYNVTVDLHKCSCLLNAQKCKQIHLF